MLLSRRRHLSRLIVSYTNKRSGGPSVFSWHQIHNTHPRLFMQSNTDSLAPLISSFAIDRYLTTKLLLIAPIPAPLPQPRRPMWCSVGCPVYLSRECRRRAHAPQHPGHVRSRPGNYPRGRPDGASLGPHRSQGMSSRSAWRRSHARLLRQVPITLRRRLDLSRRSQRPRPS